MGILNLLFITFLLHADKPATGVCVDLLMGGRVAKIVEQVRKLNPTLAPAEALGMEELYLLLKREDERYRGRELPADLREHLRTTYGGQFVVEDASRFYVNFLYNLETRVADVWRVQEGRAQSGSLLTPALESVVGHLLDSFFSPNALNDKALRAADAEVYFKTKPWLAFPWSAAISALIKFKSEKPSAGFNEFARWYSGNSLDWNQINRISLALSRTARPGGCCLSEPGCFQCPHNRRARR